MSTMSRIDDLTMDRRMSRDFEDVFEGKPKLSNWEVWTEGYRVTGNEQGAIFHGIYRGETFQDALMAFKVSLEDAKVWSLVNLAKGTFWGCRFFDNETEARASYG